VGVFVLNCMVAWSPTEKDPVKTSASLYIKANQEDSLVGITVKSRSV